MSKKINNALKEINSNNKYNRIKMKGGLTRMKFLSLSFLKKKKYDNNNNAYMQLSF